MLMTETPWLLTFSCYGNWLPGDARGFVQRVPGCAAHPSPPNPRLHRWATRRLAQSPFLLDAPARAVVSAALRDQCAHAGWMLHALHVRTNHLHMVLSGAGSPDTMMSRLKSWATRRLREAQLIDDSRRVWARHGSTVPLRTAEAVEAACRYVVERQGPPI